MIRMSGSYHFPLAECRYLQDLSHHTRDMTTFLQTSTVNTNQFVCVCADVVRKQHAAHGLAAVDLGSADKRHAAMYELLCYRGEGREGIFGKDLVSQSTLVAQFFSGESILVVASPARVVDPSRMLTQLPCDKLNTITRPHYACPSNDIQRIDGCPRIFNPSQE